MATSLIIGSSRESSAWPSSDCAGLEVREDGDLVCRLEGRDRPGVAGIDEGEADGPPVAAVQVALARLEQPGELVAAIELEDRGIDRVELLDVGGRRRHDLDGGVQRRRPAGCPRGRRSGSGRPCRPRSTAPGPAVGRGDDGPHLSPAVREGALQQSGSDTGRLALGVHEELGELEEAAALDRAGVADEPRRRPRPPTTRRHARREAETAARARAHTLSRSGFPRLAQAAREVGDRRPRRLEASARVGGGCGRHGRIRARSWPTG